MPERREVLQLVGVQAQVVELLLAGRVADEQATVVRTPQKVGGSASPRPARYCSCSSRKPERTELFVPDRTGTNDRPSAPGAGTPTRSATVGAMSTFNAIARGVAPSVSGS